MMLDFIGVSAMIEHPIYGWPVTTLGEVDTFDHVELSDGYRDGKDGEPEPGGNRSRAYWHGWRNGAVDGGHRRKDAAQALLAKLAVQETQDRAGER